MIKMLATRIEEKLIEKLKVSAEKNRRSLNKETVVAIENWLQQNQQKNNKKSTEK